MLPLHVLAIKAEGNIISPSPSVCLIISSSPWRRIDVKSAVGGALINAN